MNGVALFAGIGGLDIGINLIYPDSRTICYVEGELYCAELLAKKMQKGELVDAPIYSNVKSFASVAHLFAGKVDFITAGFPCQPFSTAGDRKGTNDERWLWFDILKIISILRPGVLFLENVSNLVNDREAFSTILTTLSEVGFNVEWSTLRASDVGANHQRNRLFIFAYQSNDASNPDQKRRREELLDLRCGQFHPIGKTQEPGYATDSDQKRQRGRHSLGARKQETGSKVEGRTDDTTYRVVTNSDPCSCEEPHLPTFPTTSEKRFSGGDYENISTPSWWQNQPDIRRVDDGVPFGMDRLRGLGNAVVPLQAATAFYHLIKRGFQ